MVSKQTLTGNLNFGVKIINPYEAAVNRGFEGSFEDWIHSISPYLVDYIDFFIDPTTGRLCGNYDIDRYSFGVNDTGGLTVEKLEG